MSTKLVLLGTGTPNAESFASGPSSAIIVDDKAYLIDFGAGVIRQASKAYQLQINALSPKNITTAFCTHLHSDHTTGLADLILTPWVLERNKPLVLYGPKGLDEMCKHIIQAYNIDIDFRINGFEKANNSGYKTIVHEINEGSIYQDDKVKVEAFKAYHSTLECYSYKFTTKDKTIVISGDTCPNDNMIKYAKDCDILLHEVYYTKGLAQRDPKWQKYHQNVHTSTIALANMAKIIKPKKLITYHRIYHMDIQQNDKNTMIEIKQREKAILDEIKSIYNGEVYNGQDLDIF